jgi:hypothetical protein
LVRAPVCGTGGRWFEPTQLYHRIWDLFRSPFQPARLPIQIERVKQRDGHRPAQRVFARKTGRSGIPAAVVLASDASGTLDARLKPSIIPMGDRQLPGEPTVPLMAAFIRTMF